MIQIALEGIILAAIVYAPLVFYSLWSWRLLRRYSDDVHGWRIRLRLPAMAAIISIGWSVIISVMLVYSELMTYNLGGDEKPFADAVFTVAILPAQVALGVVESVPGMPIYYKAPLLYWSLVTGQIVVLLLAISGIEWLFITWGRATGKGQNT